MNKKKLAAYILYGVQGLADVVLLASGGLLSMGIPGLIGYHVFLWIGIGLNVSANKSAKAPEQDEKKDGEDGEEQ